MRPSAPHRARKALRDSLRTKPPADPAESDRYEQRPSHPGQRGDLTMKIKSRTVSKQAFSRLNVFGQSPRVFSRLNTFLPTFTVQAALRCSIGQLNDLQVAAEQAVVAKWFSRLNALPTLIKPGITKTRPFSRLNESKATRSPAPSGASHIWTSDFEQHDQAKEVGMT